MTRLPAHGGWRALSVAILAGLLAVACGGQASPTSAPPPAAKTAAPAAAATQPASATAPAATAAPAAKAPPAKPVEIRLGHGLAVEEQVWLMKARPDLTPNQGKWYNLTLTPFRANADRMNAFQAGQIDGGTISAPTALFARAQGLPVKVLAEICEESSKGFTTTFLVNADSGINSIADLKGKTVAIVDHKSATDLWMREGLKTAGLNPDRDVQIVTLPFPTMGESLRSHKIDAGIFSEPFYDIEHAKGGVKDLFTTKTGVPFDEPLMLVFLNESFIQKNPDVVRAFLEDYMKVNAWYLANTKAAKQALLDAKFVASDPPSVYVDGKDQYRSPEARVNPEALGKLQDLMMQAGWFDKKVAGDLIDMSYLPK